MKTIIISILLLTISLSVFSQEERKVIREGNDYYNEGDYDNAISKFRKAYEMKPEENRLLNNIGASQYRNGMFSESAMTYENLLKMAGTREEQADAFYNIGNSYLQAADYEKSIEAYQNALRLNTNHDLSRYNMAVATKIQEQQQQQQDQQQQQGDCDGENNQDKKDQEGDQNQDKSQGNQDQQNEDQEQDKQEQSQPKENEMTREEMERFLESLQQQEKDVQEKVKKEKFKTQQRIVEKEW
ncbi:MAG: aerotolerance regulator BatC [Marinilabiliales bacterium]|nr:MAG: aerotolerance regulator BatC [Marinilabiliales bacterium]